MLDSLTQCILRERERERQLTKCADERYSDRGTPSNRYISPSDCTLFNHVPKI